jgi:hypothetical protein
VKLITRTAYGGFLQTTQLTGRPFTLVPNTTLNEKWGVQAGIIPPAPSVPFLDYFVIGNGGHKWSPVTTPSGQVIGKPEPVQHMATDAALYSQIPFVLREPANDLTPAQMAAYRLRIPQVFNGTNYIAYYAKVFDYTGVAPAMNLTTVNSDGSTTVTPFVPDSSNLNPTPPDLSSTGVNVVTGQYVTSSAKLPLNLTANDQQELLNVANIMYGDPELAIISEIGLCSGWDKTVAAGGSGQPTFNYTEAIAMQIVSFFNSFYAMEYADNGIQVLLDVGATEPLLKIAGVNA